MKNFTQFWNFAIILIILEKLEEKTYVYCNTTLHETFDGKNPSLPSPIMMKKHYSKPINTIDEKESVKKLFKDKEKKNSRHIQELANREMAKLIEMNESLIERVKLRLTRSQDAKWASLSFSFICILLLFGVCYSKMWREYHSTASHQPLPLFMIKERVPFLEVIRRKIRLLKQLQKQKKNNSEELKRLILQNEMYEMETLAKRLED